MLLLFKYKKLVCYSWSYKLLFSFFVVESFEIFFFTCNMVFLLGKIFLLGKKIHLFEVDLFFVLSYKNCF